MVAHDLTEHPDVQGYGHPFLCRFGQQTHRRRPCRRGQRHVWAADFTALAIPATLRHGAWSMLGDQLRSHQLDAMMAAIGAPSPVIAELAASQPVVFIELPPSEIDTVHKAIPELSPTVMPADTYPSQREDYKTIGYFNFAVAHKDLPDDLVYTIVKAFFANHERMIKVGSAARESVAENVKLITVLPFHPGAV